MAAEQQTTDTVLMVRPASFGVNPETAGSNAFQRESALSPTALRDAVLAQFDALAAALDSAGVRVIVVEDSAEPATPDAIFPNNWFSTHADGRVVLYPMEAENRRLERRGDVIDALATEHGFRISDVVDLTGHEAVGRFLEGTGSLVLDRIDGTAYACLSSRTDVGVLGDFAQRLDYEAAVFEAFDVRGRPIYHTNVVMSIGERLAIVATEAIADTGVRDAIVARLRGAGRSVLPLRIEQIDSFAGNMLELRSTNGPLVVMSQRAANALDATQRRRIESHGSVLAVPIDDIEQVGGGSVRCMLAEIHLPLR